MRSSRCSRTSLAARPSAKGRGGWRSERYSWDDIARRLIAIYEEVLARLMRAAHPARADRGQSSLAAAGVVALVWWRGPDMDTSGDAFYRGDLEVGRSPRSASTCSRSSLARLPGGR